MTVCIGYGGYIPAVTSENLFGKTYGHLTYKSAVQTFPKGIDLPADKKYLTQAMKEHKTPSEVIRRTAAQCVGVDKMDDTYKKPMDQEALYKFYGISTAEMDEIAAKKQLDRNTKAFYGTTDESAARPKKKVQTYEEAVREFHAVDEKKELRRGNAIPGYGGFKRRVLADNIFGVTHAEGIKRSQDSMGRIEDEKCETLKMNSAFVPAYKRPKPEDEWF